MGSIPAPAPGLTPAPQLPIPWIETPLVESVKLSKAAGCRIFLKLENLQPAGSFKSRGIGNLIRRTLQTHPSPSLTHFYSSSGGNAGLACATAAHTLGRPCTVIVPLTTSPLMISKIRDAGATAVVQRGATWSEADHYLREEVLLAGDGDGDGDPKNGVYVPPFDHPDVWAGAATMVGEWQRQMGSGGGKPKLDAVVCSVGGGGLFAGIMTGLLSEEEEEEGGKSSRRRGGGGEDDKVLLPRVLAVETAGADSLAQSLAAGELVTLPHLTSIATSLSASRVAARAFSLAQLPNVMSVVLQDAEAAMGCWRLADEERMLVEPACGASVALCYGGRLRRLVPGLGPESRVVVVVCGGSNVTLEMLVEYRRMYGSSVEEGM